MALYCYLETQSSQTPEHQIQQSGRTRASIRPHIMQTVFKIASCWSWWNYKPRTWCSMPVIYDHRSLQAECFQGTSSLLVICMQLILSPKRCFSSGHWTDICSFGRPAFKKNDLFWSITTLKQTSMQNVILKQLTYYLQVRCLLFCHLLNDKLSHLAAAAIWTGPAVCSF